MTAQKTDTPTLDEQICYQEAHVSDDFDDEISALEAIEDASLKRLAAIDAVAAPEPNWLRLRNGFFVESDGSEVPTYGQYATRADYDALRDKLKAETAGADAATVDTMKPVPKDAPVLKAWNNYKASDEFKNTRKWALHDDHVDGSLWAAFYAGYFACAVADVKAQSAAVDLSEPVAWMQSDHLNKLIQKHCGSQSMLARVSDNKVQPDYRPLYGPEVADKLKAETARADRATAIADRLDRMWRKELERADKAEARVKALELELSQVNGETPYGN